ncbi:alpha/beta hydrolase fold domain-containing protein [Sphingomonas oryzagri]|uniref:Alpha/beta hydrolase fold domain-containing protein n=1 Tax=Sphingomonas oryzagri TaxID=3042314 RepID=A0ABT6N285_9SPHN|nr:alpha/beta hydrolase fold domain-containing protein [Sphingomonas oryzagri]MDH7638496.1 alpha/beta hydrolase fold domain-containing protein [Sphingomonas oryzagri]
MTRTAMKLGFAYLAISAAGWANAGPVRHVPAYDLPIPSTVSPQLQAAIAKAPPSEPAASMPTTNAGWIARSNPDPARTHADVVRLLDRYRLTLTEERIGGVHCYVIAPRGREMQPGRLLVHIHGGAYTAGAGEAGVGEAILLAGASGIRTVSIDYRMPPEFSFPVPVDDAVAAWKQIVQRWPGRKIGLFGTSTGGAMVLEVTQRAIAEHFRVPDAIIAGTPWSDLSETGDSYFTNRYADPMVYQGDLSVSAAQYAHGMDLKDPRLSPIYGSFAAFPPTLLLTGTRDLFLSNTIRVDRKLRDADRHSELIVYEGESHATYLAGPDVPESVTAMKDMTAFFARTLR